MKIDRGATAPPSIDKRSPKLLLLALSVLIVPLAGCGYLYFSSARKAYFRGRGKVKGGGSSTEETVLSASGYVVAHHKIAVGARVMGRVAWIGVEKGDRVQQGQVLVRLEDGEFRAQSSQARAQILQRPRARLDQVRAGSRPQEKLKDKAGVLQAEASLRNAGSRI